MNSLKDKEITGNNVVDVYSAYKGKISEIKRMNKNCKIFVVPLLPTKMMSINKKNVKFNSFLFDDLLQSFDCVSVVSGLTQFVDRESGLLLDSLSRYRTDPLHLNSTGVGLLVRLIKFAIFQRKNSSKIYSNRSYSSAVSGHPPS